MMRNLFLCCLQSTTQQPTIQIQLKYQDSNRMLTQYTRLKGMAERDGNKRKIRREMKFNQIVHTILPPPLAWWCSWSCTTSLIITTTSSRFKCTQSKSDINKRKPQPAAVSTATTSRHHHSHEVRSNWVDVLNWLSKKRQDSTLCCHHHLRHFRQYHYAKGMSAVAVALSALH